MPSLDQKTQNAIDASRALIALLERCGERNWQAPVHNIRDALQGYELDSAVSLYDCLPMSCMGGLLDLYLCKENGHTVRDVTADNKKLKAAIGALGKTLENLRAYMQHEIDNPLVRVPDAA